MLKDQCGRSGVWRVGGGVEWCATCAGDDDFSSGADCVLCGEVGLMRYKLLRGIDEGAPAPRSEGGAQAPTERRQRHVRSRPQAAGEIRYVRTWGIPIENLEHTIKCCEAGTMSVGK